MRKDHNQDAHKRAPANDDKALFLRKRILYRNGEIVYKDGYRISEANTMFTTISFRFVFVLLVNHHEIVCTNVHHGKSVVLLPLGGVPLIFSTGLYLIIAAAVLALLRARRHRVG